MISPKFILGASVAFFEKSASDWIYQQLVLTRPFHYKLFNTNYRLRFSLSALVRDLTEHEKLQDITFPLFHFHSHCKDLNLQKLRLIIFCVSNYVVFASLSVFSSFELSPDTCNHIVTLCSEKNKFAMNRNFSFIHSFTNSNNVYYNFATKVNDVQ